MSNIFKLIISIVVPLAIGFTSSFFTVTGPGSWYASINKPLWNPPDSVFGPVWTILYVMMGIAFFLVWKSGNNRYRSIAIGLFICQLIVNFFWSYIFFDQHQPGWAFIEICALWALIILTIFAFARIHNGAAWLLVPYVSWVTFAAILNYTIWKLN